MTLSPDSIKWAIEFLQKYSDGDLFPKVVELSAISERADDFGDSILARHLSAFEPRCSRRFIVPKDEVAYRQATQLHPQDSIILSALMFQYGQGIEQRRLPQDIVYSYRFKPDIGTGLFSNQPTWNDFWLAAYEKSMNVSTVLLCDIADFYNQIYHHVIENQLAESDFPNQATKWIIALLESTTAGVSRGVPIGPHAVHLLAEAALVPIDNSIVSWGLDFIRYADDIIVFCDSQAAAKLALARLATTLDKQQRLLLQRHKTRPYEAADFRELCEKNIEDRPISDDEDRVLGVIRKYSGGNPYQTVSFEEISTEDWHGITEGMIRNIILEYIQQREVDYVHLRWFLQKVSPNRPPGSN